MKTILSNKKIASVLAIVFWIAVWQIVAMVINNKITIASPVDTVKALAGLILQGDFWIRVCNTGLKIAIGFSGALIVGIGLAALSHAVPLVWTLISPLARVIKAIPVASFIIMALLWIKSSWLPCFISFLMVLPIIIINMYNGISSADKKLLEAALVFKTPLHKRIAHIYTPAALPHLYSACSSGLGLSWKSAVAAEVIVLPAATVGEQLYYTKLYLQTPELFAYTAVIVLASALFEKGILALIGRLSGRYGEKKYAD